ncbi:uncharacterized protein LOC128955029 [Oppia nitens]|uniref:uncharacterized protein LOC128955029 n=1 Tax=Oppia nitens TaxID=1686743 RepID=UPI0023DC6307|nr:uncharacterized protein LOC128955029 [Oppia nitens]
MAYNWRTTNNNPIKQKQRQLPVFGQWFQTKPNKSILSLLTIPTTRSAYTMNIVDIKQRFNLTIVKIGVQSYIDNTSVVTVGTGFRIISTSSSHPMMIIVTNAHVVKGRHRVMVEVYINDRLIQLPASVVYVEQHRDLALVRLIRQNNDNFQPQPIVGAEAAATAADDDLIGQPVASVGHTSVRGGRSCQSGYVRASGVQIRQIHDPSTVSLIFTGPDQPVLVHSAPVLPGYSGGALVNSDAHVIGVQSSANLCENINYAVPNTRLLEFIARGIAYHSRESDRLRQHFRKLYELDSQAVAVVDGSGKKRLLGLVVSRQPFTGSFSVKSALPTVASIDANGIIGTHIWQINNQVINNIDDIRSAIDDNPIIRLSLSVLCIPSPVTALLAMAYTNNRPSISQWLPQQLANDRNCRSAYRQPRYCLRLAFMDSSVRNGGDDIIDLIDMKNKCIRSVCLVIRPELDDYLVDSGKGTGVFVLNNCLLLTCFHLVKQSPTVWIKYVKQYNRERVVTTWRAEPAQVVYVEPHWDLALVRLWEPPTFVGDTMTTMKLLYTTTSAAATTDSIGFGAPVCTIGHGNSIMFAIHPGMVRTPQLLTHQLLNGYNVSTIAFDEELPSVMHSSIILPGFSGSPLIDTAGRLCGIDWGGITVDRKSYASDYQILNEFINRSLAYESSGSKQSRLKKLFPIVSGKQLAIVLSAKPTGDLPAMMLLTVEAVLTNETNELPSIVKTRIVSINGQLVNDIRDLIAIVSQSQQPTVELTVRDDNLNDRTVRLNTLDRDSAFIF